MAGAGRVLAGAGRMPDRSRAVALRKGAIALRWFGGSGAIVLSCGQGCGAIAGLGLAEAGGLALAGLEFWRGKRLGC